MVSAGQQTRPVGTLLRHWREQRRLSQLALALDAEISARHLSFIETGRSLPSRDMILLLADHLQVPLRERNDLLLAGGYAPAYAHTDLDSPHLEVVRGAVRQILLGHEPYPAVVIDRYWNLVESNASAAALTVGIAPELLSPPANVLRAALHPRGMAQHIVNLGEWRAHLLARLRHQVARTSDVALARLYDELRSYPSDGPEPGVEVPGPGAVAVPLRIRYRGEELAFVSTVATFGAPLDVTVAELAIESFFPADERTASILRETLSP